MKDFDNFGDMSILSVEDDSFNQELAAAIFENEANITVYQATDGQEGIEILDEKNIDIILLDIVMPNMNGLEMLKYLKESGLYSHIPVIMVTSENSEKKSTYLLGADDFISKPYNPEELKLRVHTHLKIKKFCDVLHEIKDGVEGEKAVSDNQLCNIKEALILVDHSQKKLLQKLGNLAHQNGHKDENASARLGEYIKILANLYGLDKKMIDNLYYSMAIYDIGLLRIEKNIIESDDTPLFKQHTTLGLEILDDLEETALIRMAKDVMLYHHENWDGTGYPKGLKGEEIPISARMAAIVDYYDELTASRFYAKERINSQDALEIITRDKGVRFDPNLTDIFASNFNQFKAIKTKLTT